MVVTCSVLDWINVGVVLLTEEAGVVLVTWLVPSVDDLVDDSEPVEAP